MNNGVKRIIAAVAACMAVPLAACGGKPSGESKKENSPDYSLEYVYDGFGAYSVTGYTDLEGAIERGDDVSALEIPSSYLGKPVTGIAARAFSGLDGIFEIKIPDSVAYIGESAFSGCASLRALELGNGIDLIERDAFYGCDALGTVRYWGNADEWCGITFESAASNPVSYCDDFYIDGASASSVTVCADAVKPYAFYRCPSVRSVALSGAVRSIGESAFDCCINLSELSLGTKLVSVGRNAFRQTAVKSVTLPKTLASIADGAFDGCVLLYEVYNLSALEIEKGSDACGSVAAFALDMRKEGEPSGVKTQGEFTFYTSGDGETFLTGANKYFSRLTLPAIETKYAVAPYAFAGRPYTRVTIPDCVTEVGAMAFALNTRLAAADISASVVKFGAGAFFGCESLKSVHYGGSFEDWEKIEFEEGDLGIGGSSDPLYLGAVLYTGTGS